MELRSGTTLPSGKWNAEQAAYDQARTAYLEAQGYRVIRFENNQVLQALPEVLQFISVAVGAISESNQTQISGPKPA